MTEARMPARLQGRVAGGSPWPDAARVNRVMAMAGAELRRIGLSVRRVPGRDGFGDHLAAESPGGGDARILILCHLDMVHPLGAFGDRPFRVADGRAHGPGTLDMKGGAVKLPVRVPVTSDEEAGPPTSRARIAAEGECARFVLVPEPARPGGRCVTGRRGVGDYGIAVHGRAAHSGGAHADGRSAIREMARQVPAIEGMTDQARGLTLSVGRIERGTAGTTVPERCRVRIDGRMDTEAPAAEIDARLKALHPVGPDVTVKVEGGINRPPYTKNAGVAALYAKARGLAAEIGFDLQDMHRAGAATAASSPDGSRRWTGSGWTGPVRIHWTSM